MIKREIYAVEDTKLVRQRRFCPRCGPGVFLGEHKDRFSCGRCGYTEFKKEAKPKESKPKESKPKEEAPVETPVEAPVEAPKKEAKPKEEKTAESKPKAASKSKAKKPAKEE